MTVSIQVKRFVKLGKVTDEALVLIQNITKIRKFEKYQARKKFEVIYFGSVAHDLRTPVNTCLQVNQQVFGFLPSHL